MAADRQPVDIPSHRVAPPLFCGFPISVDVVTNNEFQTVETVGSVDTTKITGNLVLKFTNQTTGKTITKNLSGPTVDVFDNATGVDHFTGGGNNFEFFGTRSRTNTGEPGLVFTNGNVTVDATQGTVTSFVLHGHQENGCSLLS
jgi:hypothetical protein